MKRLFQCIECGKVFEAVSPAEVSELTPNMYWSTGGALLNEHYSICPDCQEYALYIQKIQCPCCDKLFDISPLDESKMKSAEDLKAAYWKKGTEYYTQCPKCGIVIPIDKSSRPKQAKRPLLIELHATNIAILDAVYRLHIESDEEFAKRFEHDVSGCGGLCNSFTKEIYIAQRDTEPEGKETRDEMVKMALRHEIVHAFLFESGIDQNSWPTDAWGVNEEMVEWFSIQGPKIYQAWKEADAL